MSTRTQKNMIKDATVLQNAYNHYHVANGGNMTKAIDDVVTEYLVAYRWVTGNFLPIADKDHITIVMKECVREFIESNHTEPITVMLEELYKPFMNNICEWFGVSELCAPIYEIMLFASTWDLGTVSKLNFEPGYMINPFNQARILVERDPPSQEPIQPFNIARLTETPIKKASVDKKVDKKTDKKKRKRKPASSATEDSDQEKPKRKRPRIIKGDKDVQKAGNEKINEKLVELGGIVCYYRENTDFPCVFVGMRGRVPMMEVPPRSGNILSASAAATYLCFKECQSRDIKNTSYNKSGYEALSVEVDATKHVSEWIQFGEFMTENVRLGVDQPDYESLKIGGSTIRMGIYEDIKSYNLISGFEVYAEEQDGVKIKKRASKNLK